MPQNGEMNLRFGVYKNVCCGAELVISAGSTFPDCPTSQAHDDLETGGRTPSEPKGGGIGL